MKPGAPALRAFTLVEVLVASTLAALAMTAVLSSFVFLARNFTRLANHQALEEQGRRALAWLQSDLAQARAVKPGSSPTAGALTLVLPAGEVTYTYDSTALRLRRQADFGATTDLYLLTNAGCRCASFAFRYYTGTGGSPADQVTPSLNVPYSIKQVQVEFLLQSPSTQPVETRRQYAMVSSRLQIRNKQAPDGG